MQLFTFGRGSAIVREVIQVEPAYASASAALDSAFASAAGVADLPPDLIALRRDATRRNWAEGLTAWNARAARHLQVMRQHGAEAATARMLQRVFAADFGGARLDDGLDAAEATFVGDLLLDGATLLHALRLDGAQLLASVDLSGVRVGHDITAEQAQFVGPVNAADLIATRSVRLGYSEFRSDVTLDRADIGKELWLRNAKIGGAFSMRGARLRRDAGLGSCNYGGAVTLDDTQFGDTVSFEGATIRDRLSLDRCAFAGRLWLTGLVPSGGISVVGARFAGDIVPPLHDILPISSPQRDLVERLRRGEAR